MLSVLNIAACCMFCSCKNKPESTTKSYSSYRPLEIKIEKEFTTYEAADGGKLDSKPEIIHYVKPEYPWLSRAAGIEGTALIEVIIDTDGKVKKAQILESDISPVMEQYLLRAVEYYTYRPAIRNNKPIICKATHLIRFTLNDDVIPIEIH
jgi:TonB family protein